MNSTEMDNRGDLEKNLQELMRDLQERISQIIPSSMPESYNCEKCHDTTWVPVKDEDGVVRYDRCSCYRVARAKELVEKSGLSAFVDSKTFDSFKTSNPVRKQIKEKAQEYLTELLAGMDKKDKHLQWFYIGGNPGSGKTHICTAICGELLKRGIQVKYMQWTNESRKLKFSQSDDNFEERLAEYINPTVLYVDDLLKQRYCDDPHFTEGDIKTAFTILDTRYALNKPTIISCEWSLTGHLLAADEAVFSRVYERCKGYMIHIKRDTTNNYRIEGDPYDG